MADAKNKAEERQMMVGDKVLVKQQSAKFESRFAPIIHTVAKVKGSMITMGHQITRNVSFFTKYHQIVIQKV